jgi:hypothetical protein
MLGSVDEAEDLVQHAFVNDLGRPVGTHLYGRRMYETMAVWQTVGDEPGVPAAETEFAEVWRALDKGLVDGVHLLVFPVVVGGSKAGLPRDVRMDLELLDERRFGDGVALLTTPLERRARWHHPRRTDGPWRPVRRPV